MLRARLMMIKLKNIFMSISTIFKSQNFVNMT